MQAPAQKPKPYDDVYRSKRAVAAGDCPQPGHQPNPKYNDPETEVRRGHDHPHECPRRGAMPSERETGGAAPSDAAG